MTIRHTWHLIVYELMSLVNSAFALCYNSPLNTTDWVLLGMGDTYEPGDHDIEIEWSAIETCTSTTLYVDDVLIEDNAPTPTPVGTPTRKPTPTPTPLPELPWVTENPYFLNWTDYWDYRPPQTYPCGVSGGGDPYMPCFRIRRFGELRQRFYNQDYCEIDVVALARQDTCPAEAVQFELCLAVGANDTPFDCRQYNMPHNSQDEYYVVYDYMDEGFYTVSRPLHLSRCPQQPPHRESGERSSCVPLQNQLGSDQVLHPASRKIHPSLSSTRPAQELCQGALLWPLQSCPSSKTRTAAHSTRRAAHRYSDLNSSGGRKYTVRNTAHRHGHADRALSGLWSPHATSGYAPAPRTCTPMTDLARTPSMYLTPPGTVHLHCAAHPARQFAGKCLLSASCFTSVYRLLASSTKLTTICHLCPLAFWEYNIPQEHDLTPHVAGGVWLAFQSRTT
jgi:hypothetical protein